MKKDPKKADKKPAVTDTNNSSQQKVNEEVDDSSNSNAVVPDAIDTS